MITLQLDLPTANLVLSALVLQRRMLGLPESPTANSAYNRLKVVIDTLAPAIVEEEKEEVLASVQPKEAGGYSPGSGV